MDYFTRFLNQSTEFRVYTGDITSGDVVRNRQFADPTAELLECVKIQLERWSSRKENLSYENGCAAVKNLTSPSSKMGLEENRSTVDISVKLFLSDADTNAIHECISAVLKELEVKRLDNVIVALPPFEGPKTDADSLTCQFLRIWPSLESLITAGTVKEVGVADLEYPDLSNLVSHLSGHVLPTVNHYNMSGCCKMSEELAEFARQHNISLVAHSDPHPFLTARQVQELLTGCFHIGDDIAKRWKAVYACRYTVLEKCTSVIAVQGYFVHFFKTL
ncbi:hypothetical protein M514_12886 [Trichuris suis]|uniref:GCS light chain n=1 Tax=Trichuris suis TaxID=68888 RepID=A0A085MT60_9BILA|nr:hypothetical protein M513_12886 [Trichuris suis]KFD60406.1 hypothetical protein M514_12886 [Trichuris suis]KHJ46499.1 hypothetical protein D918_03552 [Trichuris suis]